MRRPRDSRRRYGALRCLLFTGLFAVLAACAPAPATHPSPVTPARLSSSSSTAPSTATAAGRPAAAGSEADPVPARRLIARLIADPRVLTHDWTAIASVLPPDCLRRPGTRVLECPPVPGLVRIAVDPGPLGIIDLLLTDPVGCDDIRAIVEARYGAARTNDTGECRLDWRPDSPVRGVYLRLSPAPRQPGRLQLQFGTEQGP